MAPPPKAIQLRSWHILGGFGLFSMGAWLTQQMSSQSDADEEGIEDTGISRYDILATRYDDAVSSEENLTGIWFLRKWLMSHAKGDVLEMSAGTGRNLPYYPLDKKITSLTLTDLSLPMLSRAEDKYHEGLRLADKASFQTRFCLSDSHCMIAKSKKEEVVLTLPVLRKRMSEGGGLAPQSKSIDSSGQDSPPSQRAWWKPWTYPSPSPCHCCQGPSGDDQEVGYQLRCKSGTTPDGLPLSHFPPASFDTVIDCFGLCSHEDPVLVLQEASRLCKPGGRILLLQHGRSYYDLLNYYLDEHAPRHHSTWGCLWNKDINEIIKKAGLVVERESRWHFGTTYVIVARKQGLS